VALTGTLSPTVAGASVVLAIKHPDGTTTSETATLDASGGFGASYDPDRPGSWVASASYGGDRGHASAVGSPCATSVPVPPPTIESIIATCDATGTVGIPVTTGGTLTPPVVGASVTIQITDPGAANTSQSASVGSDGRFSITYTPTSAGMWSATATYGGDATHASTTGMACLTAVAK
jgi:hypothetical protein